jgi:uncharacterized protein (TIGR02001 family)
LHNAPRRSRLDHATHWEKKIMGQSRYLLVALGLAASQGASAAEFSANAGVMSDYIFRGIKQADAGAFGGLDWEHAGFYAGTWAADVGLGLEYDLYAGYGGSVGEFAYGIGYTGYFYTDDFDDTYRELNLSVGYGLFSVDYAHGRYDNFDGPSQDYGFFLGTLEYDGFYLSYGKFTKDFAGHYWEAGYGTEVAGFDTSVAIIFSSDEFEHHPAGISGETFLVFTLGKTFHLR